MNKIELTRRNIILGASGALLSYAPASYSQPLNGLQGGSIASFQIAVWNNAEGRYNVLPFDVDLVEDIAGNGLTAAIIAIQTYIKNSFADFGTHAVTRDTIGRGIAAAAVVKAVGKVASGPRLNASDVAFQIGTSIANAIFITTAQELIQLKLRRGGMAEQKAKWIAFALAWTEIGAFALLMSNFIHDALFRAKNIPPRNHTQATPADHPFAAELRRRVLLEIPVPNVLDRFVFNAKVSDPFPARADSILQATGTTVGYGEQYDFKILQAFLPNGRPAPEYYVSWKKNRIGVFIHSKVVRNGT